MYYSPIFYEKYADINLVPKKYPIDYNIGTNNIDGRYWIPGVNIENNINIDELNEKKYVIILSIQRPEFLNIAFSYIEKLKVPFIIITFSEDWEFPLDHFAEKQKIPSFTDIVEKLKSNIYFKHWFANNKTIPNTDKLTSIPLGLDFWAQRTRPFFGESPKNVDLQNKILKDIVSNTIHFSKRIPIAFCNFHFNFTDDRYYGDRRKLLNILSNKVAYFQEKKTPRSETWLQMSKFSFVISPFGHGMDCIRTMEALCLGCIVIMKNSCLNCIYEDLPVLFVNNWEDITEELLKKTLVEYSNKSFNYNKIMFNYWYELVLAKLKD